MFHMRSNRTYAERQNVFLLSSETDLWCSQYANYNCTLGVKFEISGCCNFRKRLTKYFIPYPHSSSDWSSLPMTVINLSLCINWYNYTSILLTSNYQQQRFSSSIRHHQHHDLPPGLHSSLPLPFIGHFMLSSHPPSYALHVVQCSVLLAQYSYLLTVNCGKSGPARHGVPLLNSPPTGSLHLTWRGTPRT